MGRKVYVDRKPNSEIKKVHCSNTRLFFSFIILCHCTIITNPDTYICDPFHSNSISNHANNLHNNQHIISCSTLLSYDNDIDHPQQQHDHTHKPQHNNNNKHNISSFADELHKLFHSENENVNYYTYYLDHNHRYHTYYHYNLEHLRKTSYIDYMKDMEHQLQNWWNTFSFYTVWMKIPNSWKMRTVAVGIADTLFIVIIKYLVFEDNYEF